MNPIGPQPWQAVAAEMRVVRLGLIAQILIPALLLSTIPKQTRGVSFYPGRGGFALGAVLLVGSVTLPILLTGFDSLLVAIISIWSLGTAGAAMMFSSV